MRDINVEQIKKLWVLNLVIQEGSLRKAALRAKVTPSAVSQTISSLEKTVGKPLLIRDGGGVRASQDAISILGIVQPAFDAFSRLREIRDMPVPAISWLKFGTYESIAIEVLPGLMHSLRSKLPHLRLDLKISRTANLLQMVRKGELCSALVTEVDSLDRFFVREVATDRLGFFVSDRQPIGRLGWKAVEKFGLGTLAPGKDGLPRYYTKFLRQTSGIKPLMTSDSMETLRAVADSGYLVSVLPYRVAMRTEGLKEILPPRVSVSRDSGIHKILVVSQANCDPVEVDFIANEALRLLGQERQKMNAQP